MVIATGQPVLASDFLNLVFLPKGTVLMYDGTNWQDNKTLIGWYQCNGQNDTPDMRDKFIRVTDSAGAIGGNHSSTIPLPVHKHDIATGKFADKSVLHNHDIRTYGPPAGADRMTQRGSEYTNYGLAVDAAPRRTVSTGGSRSSNSHYHSLSTTIGYAGSSAPIDIKPDYYRVIYIIKMV